MDWSRRRRLLPDDRGTSMVLVIGIGAVLSIIAAVMAAQSINNLRQAGNERRYEQALHVADAGIDDSLYRLSQTGGAYFTGEAVPAPFASAQAERTWILMQANVAVTANPARLITTTEGQWVTIVDPNEATGGKTGVIYSVGFVPSKASATKTRIVRAEYDFAPFVPSSAILSDGNLTISGNPAVTGTSGNVHANGNLNLSGDPTTTGSVSASGTCSGCTDSGIGDPANSGGGRPEQKVPDLDPRSAYAHSEYDLCPDGTVRPGPAYFGAGANTTGIPCGSPTVLASSGSEYRNWKMAGTDASQGAKWDYSGDTAYDGVYYMYRGSAKISGNPGTEANPWDVTILAEATHAAGPEPNCPHTGGDIEISGNPSIRPHVRATPLALVAGRDLKVSGNPDGVLEGVYAAHEQFDVSGNPDLKGAVLSTSGCNTAGSPVPASTISGNPTIQFDELELPVSDLVRTTLWLEV
jgi:hypothetical protein